MTQPVTNVTIENKTGPGCLVRGAYFFFVGWWFGLVWILFAWAFNLTIIGLPLGLAMINSVPQVTTLRPKRVQTTVVTENGNMVVQHTAIKQRPFIWRALFFILVGWWFSLFWMLLAWALAVFTFGLATPLSMWMFDRVPALTTLART